LVLARYARIRPGETLDTAFTASGIICYVIRGSGSTTDGREGIAWNIGDLFILPGGPSYTHAAESDAVLWIVTNEPQLAFEHLRAPADGKAPTAIVHFTAEEIEPCRLQAFALMQSCGLKIATRPETTVITTPADFERFFPATGGALYGQASHGWTASFTRPGARTKIPGLYLAGGSTHPGPGVPMAALSGRLAAASILQDLASAAPSRRAAMLGGMSTA